MGIVRKDLDFNNLGMEGINFIDCNNKAIELFGCATKSELINAKPHELSPELQPGGGFSKDEALRKVESALKGDPQFFEWKHKKLNGELIDTEVSMNIIETNKRKNLIAVVRDITRRKKAEAINEVLFNISMATSQSNSLELLFSTIHIEVDKLMDAKNFYVALVVDLEKSLFVFPYEVDEYSEEPMPPNKIFDLSYGLTDHVAKQGEALLANKYNMDELFQNNELRLIGRDSESWLGIPLISQRDGVIGVLAIQSYSDPDAYREIDMEVLMTTSTTVAAAIIQKHSEESLKKSEEKFIQLFEYIPDAVFLTRYGGENSGEILSANPAAEEQTGYSINELKGKNWFEVIVPKDKYWVMGDNR